MDAAIHLTDSSQTLEAPELLYTRLSQLYADLQSRHSAQKQEMIEYKSKANYWETQFQKLKSREIELLSEVDELKAKLRKRERELFGRKSEKPTAVSEKNPSASQVEPKKKRGQQFGSSGHGRRNYSHLPTTEEIVSLAEDHARCVCCGMPYQELSGGETSEILEVINVQAHRRLINRKRYKRSCRCKKNPDPQILLAPTADRLIPKSKLGISIWALLLINKYEYEHPVNRTLEQLSNHGLSLSAGTVTDGMQKLLPLLTPVYDAIVKHNLTANHWHADETGWKVFESKEGKTNNRWFLWIFHNQESVVYKISDSRSSQVLIDYFGESRASGILNVDRYVAYKTIANSGLFTLAFCWAHVRRDFLNHANAYPEHQQWGLAWVASIAKLYHINNQRIEHKAETKLFIEFDKALRSALEDMKKTCEVEMNDATIPLSAKKILTSLTNHWFGLTVFVEHPEIPMDNNQAERGLRGSVVGRKNYYGSGAIWSAQLAACMFTIFETLKIWKMNPHTWLLTYFYECAMNPGIPPADIERYLPWKMREETRN